MIFKCEICDKILEIKENNVKHGKKHYCSNECRYKGQAEQKRTAYEINGFLYIELPNGNITKIDAIDGDLAKLNWYSQNDYVIRKNKDRKYIYIHREIFERKIGRHLKHLEEVDHINGNRSDNTRDNLRLVTRSENCANLKKVLNNPRITSKYKGVSFYKQKNMYRARITHLGKTIHLGYFYDEIEAAIEYDKNAINYFGENAKLNFPERSYASPIHLRNGCAYLASA